MFSRNSEKILNLIKSPIFTNAPCKSTCLYNAPVCLREAKPRGFQTGGVFPFFRVADPFGTVPRRTDVGALNRPRKRKGMNRENPRTIPSKSGKSRKNRESSKKDKNERTSPDRETPPV